MQLVTVPAEKVNASFSLSVNDSLAKIEELLERYALDKANIMQMHQFLSGSGNEIYLRYLYDSRSIYVSNAILPLEKAIKVLDAEYWNKALRMTDVYELMPHNKKEEWNKNIDELNVWAFERQTVIDTLSTLIDRRPSYFAESVDHIFRKLSRDHVTNVPEGFSKRMIVNYVLDNYSIGSYYVRSEKAEYLNDLRNVIAKLNGQSMTTHRNSYSMLTQITKSDLFGQWLPVDEGGLKIKLFKKGTLHIEVNPEVALKLNSVLASIYPAAIPSKFRSKSSSAPQREIQKNEKAISPEVVDFLLHTNVIKQSDRWDIYINREGFYKKAEAHQQELAQVMAFIGAREREKGIYTLNYDPSQVIKLIGVLGCYPCKKSYQYYPTPEKLVATVQTMARVGKGMSILEPSAGQGNLLEGLQSADVIHCYELSKINASILAAKKYTVNEKDFLSVDPIEKYDRILMNPPFTKNQAEKHVKHALRFLKPGGVLVSVLPAIFTHHEFLPGATHEYSPVYEKEFAGTDVRVIILAITAPEGGV